MIDYSIRIAAPAALVFEMLTEADLLTARIDLYFDPAQLMPPSAS